MKWLLGEWQSKNEKSLITESWTMDGSLLVGKGITKKFGSKSSEFIEHLSIQKIAETIFYSAKPPQNDYPVSFKLIDCSATHLKFENKTHDFPKVITYRQLSKTKMRAEVSGEKSKSFSLVFDKVLTKSLSKKDIVIRYVDSYNKKDLAAMMKFTTENINWMIISGKTVSLETKNRVELTKVLEQHFGRAGGAISSLSGIVESGAFVSAVEKSSSIKSGKKSSACSLSVYEFSQVKGEENLIKNVWYYDAEKCD